LSGAKLKPNGKFRLSATGMRDKFKQICAMAGLDQSLYSLHSMRSGGVSEGADQGLDHRDLMRHGRWKSAETCESYIKSKSKKRFHVSKSLFC